MCNLDLEISQGSLGVTYLSSYEFVIYILNRSTLKIYLKSRAREG